MYEKNGVKYYSPNESFGFPDIDTKEIPSARQDNGSFDYVCPNCKQIVDIWFIANEEEYTDNEKTYPIYCNETLGYNGWGDFHDWEEIHCCPHCHKEFIIEDGCY